MAEDNDVIAITSTLGVSRNGVQKLSLSLIAPFVSLLAYSVFQIIQAMHFYDDLPIRLKDASEITNTIKQEMIGIDILKEILISGDERIAIIKNADFGKNPLITSDQLDQWRIKITNLRATINIHRGRLEQFTSSSYPFLKDSSISLVSLLLQEDSMWVTLQLFLSAQADSESTTQNRETKFQELAEQMLALIQATGSHQAALLKSVDELEKSKREISLKFEKLLSESKSNRRNLEIYGIMSLFGALGMIACIAGIILLYRKSSENSLILLKK